MESVFESYLVGVQDGVAAVVSEQQPDDIPKTNDPVWILGKQYCAIQGKPAADIYAYYVYVHVYLWDCDYVCDLHNNAKISDTKLFAFLI